MMAVLAHPKAFAVSFRELERWDVLSLWLRKNTRVSVPLVRIGSAFHLRQEIAPAENLASGKVSMVDRVSFDGGVFSKSCGCKLGLHLRTSACSKGFRDCSPLRNLA